MENKLKRNDFVEIDFIGKIKSSGQIFDLTKEDVAKKEGIYDKNQSYKPMIICLGEGQLLQGIDSAIEGKEVGQEFEVELQPEKAFGQRNPKLIQLTTLKIFKDKKVTPMPGLQLTIDGVLATIRSVSGGRVVLDFNHPLAGKSLVYHIKINRQITDAKEKLESLCYQILHTEAKIKVEDAKVEVEIKNLDKFKDNVLEQFKAYAKKLIPELDKKEITFNKK